MTEDEFDRQKIAKQTKHALGCRCCWCQMGETAQLFEKTAKTFDDTSGVFGRILKLLE